MRFSKEMDEALLEESYDQPRTLMPFPATRPVTNSVGLVYDIYIGNVPLGRIRLD